MWVIAACCLHVRCMCGAWEVGWLCSLPLCHAQIFGGKTLCDHCAPASRARDMLVCFAGCAPWHGCLRQPVSVLCSKGATPVRCSVCPVHHGAEGRQRTCGYNARCSEARISAGATDAQPTLLAYGASSSHMLAVSGRGGGMRSPALSSYCVPCLLTACLLCLMPHCLYHPPPPHPMQHTPQPQTQQTQQTPLPHRCMCNTLLFFPGGHRGLVHEGPV